MTISARRLRAYGPITTNRHIDICRTAHYIRPTASSPAGNHSATYRRISTFGLDQGTMRSILKRARSLLRSNQEAKPAARLWHLTATLRDPDLNVTVCKSVTCHQTELARQIYLFEQGLRRDGFVGQVAFCNINVDEISPHDGHKLNW